MGKHPPPKKTVKKPSPPPQQTGKEILDVKAAPAAAAEEPNVTPEIAELRQRLYGSASPPSEIPSQGEQQAAAPEADRGPGPGRPTKEEQLKRQLETLAMFGRPEYHDVLKRSCAVYPYAINSVLRIFDEHAARTTFALDTEEQAMLLDVFTTFSAYHMPSPESMPSRATLQLVVMIIAVIVGRGRLAWDRIQAARRKGQQDRPPATKKPQPPSPPPIPPVEIPKPPAVASS